MISHKSLLLKVWFLVQQHQLHLVTYKKMQISCVPLRPPESETLGYTFRRLFFSKLSSHRKTENITAGLSLCTTSLNHTGKRLKCIDWIHLVQMVKCYFALVFSLPLCLVVILLFQLLCPVVTDYFGKICIKTICICIKNFILFNYVISKKKN